LKAIRWEWYNYQNEYNLANSGPDIDLVAAWDKWYLDYMQTRMLKARDWVSKWAKEGLFKWVFSSDPAEQTAAAISAYYWGQAWKLGGYNSVGYPRGTPTPPP
jgi:hypothetical protein